jgi:hypothetical protein
MRAAIGRGRVDEGIHFLPRMLVYITLEIDHEISTLGAGIATIAYFSREKLNNPAKSRYGQEATNPTVIRGPKLARHQCVAEIGYQQLHTMMSGNKSRRICKGRRVKDFGL